MRVKLVVTFDDVSDVEGRPDPKPGGHDRAKWRNAVEEALMSAISRAENDGHTSSLEDEISILQPTVRLVPEEVEKTPAVVAAWGVPAKLVTDDSVLTAHFDATEWFDQASDAELTQLRADGWWADCSADEVAVFFADTDRDVDFVYEYVERLRNTNRAIGTEVYVDELRAELWVRKNRPQLAAKWETTDHADGTPG